MLGKVISSPQTCIVATSAAGVAFSTLEREMS